MNKEAQNEQRLPKTEKGYNTYFANNLTVIKDNALYKVLFKLTSLQMKELNKAQKNELPTNNITFQYSLNEFRMDLQMGKTTIIKKLDILNNIGLLSITKNCNEKNGYCKNTYQLDINKLNKIVSKLNGMRRLQRIEYINSIFSVTTSKSFTKIDEGKFDNETSTTVLLNENAVEDKIEEVKTKYAASSSAQKQSSVIIPITNEQQQEVAVNNMAEQMKNLNTTNEDMTLQDMNKAIDIAKQEDALIKDREQNNEYDVTAIKWTKDINAQRNTSYYSYFNKQVGAKQMTVEEANIAIQAQHDKINNIQPVTTTEQQQTKIFEMLADEGEDEYSDEVMNMFDSVINRYGEQRISFG